MPNESMGNNEADKNLESGVESVVFMPNEAQSLPGVETKSGNDGLRSLCVLQNLGLLLPMLEKSGSASTKTKKS
ncbi:MAG: hypothetical protein WC882_06020 [Candidatus Gracilibacteria bacterium]